MGRFLSSSSFPLTSGKCPGPGYLLSSEGATPLSHTQLRAGKKAVSLLPTDNAGLPERSNRVLFQLVNHPALPERIDETTFPALREAYSGKLEKAEHEVMDYAKDGDDSKPAAQSFDFWSIFSPAEPKKVMRKANLVFCINDDLDKGSLPGQIIRLEHPDPQILSVDRITLRTLPNHYAEFKVMPPSLATRLLIRS